MRTRALAAITTVVPGLAAAALLACGCGSSGGAAADGGADAPADAVTGDAPQALALDFAITGCARYDLGAARCYGGAPLSLAFAPVSSPSLTQFLWSFGDGTPDSTARAPSHVYQLPGSYEVTLVGAGDVGSASSLQHVTVTALLAGAPCDVDAQCATGLTCVCGPGCPTPFGRGLCTSPCSADAGASACGAGAVCADVPLPANAFPPAVRADAGAAAHDAAADGAGTGGAGGAGADAAADGPAGGGGGGGGAGGGGPAGAAVDGGAGDAGVDANATIPLLRQLVCLGACQQDADCPAGLACRDLPGAVGGSSRWARACYPRVPGDVGDPCRDATGALSDAACVTGVCADLGALGACTASCAAGAPCPTGAACATFGDGRSLCVHSCQPAGSGDCARDPLLACTQSGGADALAFTVENATAADRYCAPLPCAGDAECAPAGTCAGGRCTRR